MFPFCYISSTLKKIFTELIKPDFYFMLISTNYIYHTNSPHLISIRHYRYKRVFTIELPH